MRQKICVFLVFIFLCSQNCFSVTITLGEQLKAFFSPETFQYRSNPSNRKGSAPLITADTIRSIANWYIDETCTPFITEKMQTGDIVFVHRLLLDEFIIQVSPHINVPYILITADGDPDAMETQQHLELLSNSYLVLWASINCINYQHPKAIPLPLGLYPLSSLFPGGNEKELYKEVMALSKDKLRTCLCIVNFTESTWTHPDRDRVINDLKDFSFVTFAPRVPQKKYLEALTDSCFCICPRGCGWDCFRNWECLLLGTIPILEHSVLDPLFYDLPVLIIDSFKLLTEDYLRSKLIEMKSRSYNYEKLYSDYWINFLLSMQQNLRNGQPIKKDVKKFKRKAYGIQTQVQLDRRERIKSKIQKPRP